MTTKNVDKQQVDIAIWRNKNTETFHENVKYSCASTEHMLAILNPIDNNK